MIFWPDGPTVVKDACFESFIVILLRHVRHLGFYGSMIYVYGVVWGLSAFLDSFDD